MKIGVLTYYRVPNFGANLQALSTYQYLKGAGFEVEFLYYRSKRIRYVQSKGLPHSPQAAEHYKFIDEYIPSQTEEFHNSRGILEVIKRNHIDAVIIGSDAVVQHHPRFSTLRWGQSLKDWLRPFEPERRFPNPFWGIGFSDVVPTAMMSVSSQNSPYKKFDRRTLTRMRKCLDRLKYVSVRDIWTQSMMEYIKPDLSPSVTPDPVFAFNQNAGNLVPSKEDIVKKFNLPSDYALLGLRGNVLDEDTIIKLKNMFKGRGISLVNFPIDGKMVMPLDYKIPFPLSPLDWYALLKYSKAYIGSNMHPIVVSLHNGNPCFSLDNWGTTNFWGKKINDGSSKVLDILKRFGVENNRAEISNGVCNVSAEDIYSKLLSFPKKEVSQKAHDMSILYSHMMQDILKAVK